MLLKFWCVSRCSSDPPYRDQVGEDFPVVWGPSELVQAGVKRSAGRDENRVPLWIEGDLYRYTITSDGIRSATDLLGVRRPFDPPLAIVECVADHTIALAVHQHDEYEVLAAVAADPTASVPAQLQSQLEAWSPDVTFTDQRWTRLRDFLVSLGLNANVPDNWKAANPDATPRQFFLDLKAWAEAQ